MKNERIIETSQVGKDIIEIVEVTKLEGAQSTEEAMSLYFTEKANATMKFVRIHLNGGAVKTEAGALYYLKGNIESEVNVGGVSGMIEKKIKKTLINEKSYNPVYRGYGTVVLEPTFEHYVLVELNNNSFIVDKSLYYCSLGNIEVTPAIQKNISSAFMGGEGLFQTRISGTGVVVLQLPVPMSEVEIHNLNNEMMQVDGNFAVLRSEGLQFTVEKSQRSLFKSALSGEGFLNTYRGTGMVWVAPTAPVYRNIRYGGIGGVNAAQGGSNHQE